MFSLFTLFRINTFQAHLRMSKSETGKPSYHHGDLRRALVDTGLHVLREEGLEALTLRRVAREANVSAGAPYRHFKNKQALLSAISESGFRKLHVFLETAKEEKPGDLDAAGLAYFSFAQEEPESYRLMFARNILREETVENSLKEASERAFVTLAETIEIGMQENKIAPTNETHLALATWALIHGVAMLLIDGLLSNGPYGKVPPQDILRICQSHFRAGWKML